MTSDNGDDKLRDYKKKQKTCVRKAQILVDQFCGSRFNVVL